MKTFFLKIFFLSLIFIILFLGGCSLITTTSNIEQASRKISAQIEDLSQQISQLEAQRSLLLNDWKQQKEEFEAEIAALQLRRQELETVWNTQRREYEEFTTKTKTENITHINNITKIVQNVDESVNKFNDFFFTFNMKFTLSISFALTFIAGIRYRHKWIPVFKKNLV